MKRILSISILLCSAATVSAQADIQKLKPAVKAAAKKMNDALIKKDYKAFVSTTYPKVVESTTGGLDKLEKELETQLKSIESQGTTITTAWPGEVSNIIDTAGEYQCTLPQYMKMKLKEGVLQTETTLFALSPDKGKTWYFIDATEKPLDKWRQVFPNLSSKLVLKPAPEPKFTPNKQ